MLRCPLCHDTATVAFHKDARRDYCRCLSCLLVFVLTAVWSRCAQKYGTFAELSGDAVLRGGGKPLATPLLAGVFRDPGPDGTVVRSGYRFRLWLPGRNGAAIHETGRPPAALEVGPRRDRGG